MNRDEARKALVLNLHNRDMFRHILDSLDAIEKRMAALDRPKTYGPIEINKPEIKFHLDDEEIARIKAIVAERTVCPKCGKVELACECQQYRTMAEHIAERPVGTTEEEARQDFIERALANPETFERWATDAWVSFAEWAPEDKEVFVDAVTSWWRLPLDDGGELPDYPLLRCPDVGKEQPTVDYLQHSVRYRGRHGGVGCPTAHKTRDAARAMWNKWMRERFGCSYGEGE